ncbi:AMP-binding enzyme [Streptomyces sp. Agncl-13]|uniref:AMP-binding enzyme n=1 Tax=Streptomyces sp. Agncl-13 TaxID=3400628 RepID=UPI003A879547
MRIELDEIENVVGSLPGVTGCAVFVDSVRGHDRLHAYVVASVAVTDADLRRAALAKLPASLVPRHWVRVDTLPKTTSGKVDRRRLS